MNAAAVAALVLQLGTTGAASLDHLSITYQLIGPFGGVVDFVRTPPGVDHYSIPLAYKGVAAVSMKAIVFTPTARFVLLERDRVTAREATPLRITLQPGRTVAVTGKIVTAVDPAGLRVEARYLAPWAMDFFGYLDGPVPSFDLGSVPLEKGGAFHISLPDLSHDPTVNSREDQRDPSSIELAVRDAKSGKIRYRLELEGGGRLLARNPMPERIRCVAH